MYRSRQVDLDREVAVKVLSVTDEAFVRRFNREAKTLGKLSQNPGIVTVYDTGVTDSGFPYLILELCSSSVHERLQADGRFDPIEACAVVAQVADAVGDAHANGVIHRDLKPGNVLRSQNGRYLVTDFGISTVTGATMGQTESVGFTAGYVAPETLVGDEPAGTPADVYALGATLFHMVAGRAAFVIPDQKPNLLALARRVINDPVDDLRPDGVPDEVCRVIEQTMAKDPADRPTAFELRDLLLDVIGEEPPAVRAADEREFTSVIGPMGTALRTGASATMPAANASSISRSLPRPDPGSSPESDTLQAVSQDELDGATLSSVTTIGPPPPPTDPSPTSPAAGDAAAAAAADGGAGGPLLASLADTPPPGRGIPTSIDDDEQSRAPLLVIGAMVGVLLLVAAGAALVVNLRGDRGGGGTNTETVAGPDDDSQDGSLAGGSGGDRGILDQFRDPDDPLTDPIPIPDVIGREADAAETALRQAGFAVTVVEEPSSTVAEGRVSRQSPEGGEEMVPGGVVTIYISTGRSGRLVIVPTVTGLSVSAATEALAAIGLKVEESPRFHATVPSGQVIGTLPTGGSSIDAGSTVDLLISQGPASNCAEAIGVSEAVATTRLEAQGLTVTSTTEPSSTVADGMVITCSANGTSAQLTVSSGPSVCNQVIGTNRTQARATLEAAGLTVNSVAVARSDLPVNEVFNCTIDGGTASIRYAVAPPPACPGSVVGSTVPQARLALAEVGITEVTVNTASSATVPEGQIISCSITGSTASVTSSSGPAAPTVNVPTLVGLTQAQAQTALAGVGLPNGQVVQADSPRPAGEVIRTSPAAGSAVAPSTVVTLTVSSGEAGNTTLVPDVIGMTQAQAEQALTDANLVANVMTEIVGAGSPNIGNVTAASPGVGTSLTTGTTVTITVAAPPTN